MENIKTFPVQLTESFHEKIKDCAIIQKISLKEWVLNALYEKINREKPEWIN